MRGNYQSHVILIISAILLLNFFGSIYAIEIENKQVYENKASFSLNQGFTNITVEEAWELLSDTSNGLQDPIDVRTFSEWKNERIDTTPPENPKHHCLADLEDEVKLQEFMDIYNGKELIIYCHSGGRSLTAAKILVENEFSGLIYNMLGGISAWKTGGYPTVTNQPPDVEIINPKKGYLHFSGFPIIPTLFDLIADTLALGGFRRNPVIINATDDFDISEELIVKIYLNGKEEGKAIYCCDWRLHEWFWTGLAFGNYKLRVTAEDLDGNTNSAEIEVWNLCIFH